MATFVLIHGAGSDGWYWHRVAPLLRERGHDVVAPDLPAGDDDAGLDAYLRIVLDAIGDRRDLVVVGQSLGGFTASLVPAHRHVDRLIYVNAMVPAPGETGMAWWHNVGYPVDTGDDFDPVHWFLHDVPEDVIAASASHVLDQSDRPMHDPWPLAAHADVPTRFVQGADDRFFPAEWMRGVVRARLHIEPDEIPGGHCVALSRPQELADILTEEAA